MTAIEMQGVTKRYGDVIALDELDLTVAEGEFVGLLGQNGAGKTTTINVLTGQVRPDAGRARVLGLDPVEKSIEVRRRVGILPEKEAPPSFRTPREYFSFVGDVRQIDHDVLEHRVDLWTARLDLEGTLDTLCADLSRGQQQKVMIVQAFLHEPELVFIDEPLANLDPVMQERVKSFLSVYGDAGNTILLSTHAISVAEELCDRVALIEDGRRIAERDVATLGDESLLSLFGTGVARSDV